LVEKNTAAVKATIAPAEIHMGQEMAGVAGCSRHFGGLRGSIMPTPARRVEPPRMHDCHVAARLRTAGG
jgi:hypothetical protein